MSIVLANIGATEKNASLWTVKKELRDPFMVLETVELDCLFTKFFFVTTARKDDENRQNTLFLC